ncbi:FG-GAP-like repeat-containing protein [Dokdonella sp.]|uniref:FG-GAP-like repeat-containing protein n=1 Tax=Dokdonella sp. TaxID=2291710 RepID=UPI003784AA2E
MRLKLLSSLFVCCVVPLAGAAPTTVTVDNATAAPGGQPTEMEFPLTRSGDLAYDALVRYHTIDGTAVAGTDYVAASGTVTIEAGSDQATIPVTVNAATGASESRTFQLLVDDVIGVGVIPSYAIPLASPAGDSPRSPVSADVNGDGRPDVLVLAASDDTMLVFLNETPPGAGVATYAAPGVFATGDTPRTLVVADIDNDGRPDALVANFLENTISVLLNTTAPGATTPTFAAQQTFVVGIFDARSIAVADFNGDGRIDVVASHDDFSPTPGLTVLLNTTMPGSSVVTFAPRQDFPAGVGTWDVTCADLNGDGRQDVVVGDLNAAQLWVLLNTTAPGDTSVSFAPPQAIPAGTEPRRIVAADIDGDGRRDLVVATSGANTVSILRNTTPAGSMTATFAAPDAFAVPAHSVDVFVADLNGDGRLDVGVADNVSFASTLLFNTTTSGASHFDFAVQSQIPLAAAYPSGIAAADINGDGIVDILVSDEVSNRLLTVLGETVVDRASPAFATARTFAVGMQPRYAAAADFNADGKPDLVVDNASDDSISVLLNATAAPGAEPAFAPQQVFADDDEPLQVIAPDLNGDGRPDIVTANSVANRLSVRLNATPPGAAASSFTPMQTIATGVGHAANSIVATDLDRDGKVDIVAADWGLLELDVFLNTTNAGASSVSFAPRQGFAVGSPNFVTAADLNGDGFDDLVAVNLGLDSVSVMLNATPAGGPLAFRPPQDFGVGDAPRAAAVADINGDGKPDLLVANRNDGTVSPLLNITEPGATAAAFIVGAPITAGAHAYADRAVDIDGDGRADIVATDQEGAGATLLLNATVPGATSATFDASAIDAGTRPYSSIPIDVDGDGCLDLVVVNDVLTGGFVSVLPNEQFRTMVTGSPAIGTILGDAIFADGFD